MTQWMNNAGIGKSDWIATANGADDRPVPMDFTPLNAGEDQAPLVQGFGVPALASPNRDPTDPVINSAENVEAPRLGKASREQLVGMFVYISLLSSGAGCDGYGVDFEFLPKDWRFGPYDENADYLDNDTDPRIRLNDRETEKLLYDIGEILGEYAELVSCTGAIRADRIFATDDHDIQRIKYILVVPQSVATRLTDYVAHPDHFFRESFKKGDRSKPALLDVSVSITASGHAPIEEIFAALQVLDPAEANANFGGSVTPERMPRSGESCEEWAGRVCVSEEQCDEIEMTWQRCGKNPMIMKAAMSAMTDEVPEIQWVVADLIPREEIVLLVGKAGCGKSTLASELAQKIANYGNVPQQTFLGAEVMTGGSVLIFPGEGAPQIWAQRLAIMGPRKNVFVVPARELSLEQIIDTALSVPNLALVVLDPLSRWLSDENDNVDCGQVMRQLEYLTSKTGCAVLVVHHPKKGMHRTIAAMGEAVRGGSVLVDRPRMVLAMIDRNDGLIDVGIVKSNVGNTWGANGQPRRFQRNVELLTLEDAQGATPTKHAMPAASDVYGVDVDALVIETVSRLTLAGRKVRRSGDNSVYRNRSSALAVASRNTIEQAVNRLISSGGLLIADGVILPQNHAR